MIRNLEKYNSSFKFWLVEEIDRVLDNIKIQGSFLWYILEQDFSLLFLQFYGGYCSWKLLLKPELCRRLLQGKGCAQVVGQEGSRQILQDGLGVQSNKLLPTSSVHQFNITGVSPEAIMNYKT